MVRWLRHRRGDHRIYILAYHDVAGRDENESEGTLSGSRFQRHVAYVKQRLATATTDTGRTLYSIFGDANSDGRINALDVATLKQRLGRVLPGPEPTALFGGRRLDQSVLSEVLA